MTTSPDRVLVDTNVLVYAYNSDAAEHAASRALVEQGGVGSLAACLCPQVLLEFLVAVTNPKRVRNARSVAQASLLVEELAAALPLIQPPSDVHARVVGLYRGGASFGRAQAYDLALAATMLANGVSRVCSFDDVFERVPGITVVRP